jgi:cob(I)alamin adenosyltransferase
LRVVTPAKRTGVVKLNKIYTRTGDAGTTGLVDGSRITKDDVRMAAIGDVDEANCAIGAALLLLDTLTDKAVLARVQNELFDLGADIATPGGDFTPGEMTLRVTAAQVTRLEEEIDAMNANLPPLTSFILPGGTAAAAAIHLARATVRRAERAMVRAASEVTLNPMALAYINRLSDHLFVLARHTSAKSGGDILWVPGQSRA